MNAQDRKLASRERWSTVLSFAQDMFFYIVGSIVFAGSVDIFTSPNNIAPGGIVGVSTMVNHLTDIPIGVFVMMCNVPIFIVGFFLIGKAYMAKSLFCMVFSSVVIDLLEPILPKYTENPLLAAVFGGVCSGIGLGLIFSRGGSTGGTDIIARIVGKFKPHMTQGKIMLVFDFAVIGISAFVFGFEAAMYAIIMVYVSSKMIDMVLYGKDDGKVLFIVTDNPEPIKKGLLNQIERGVTLLKGEGAYSGAERDVLMCAVAINEVYKVRVIVKKADPKAFIIVGKADQILGEGFKAIERNEFGETIQDK